MKKTILIALSLPLFIGCKFINRNPENILQPVTSSVVEEIDIAFLSKGDFTIREFEKSSDSQSSDPDTLYCQEWNLTEYQAKEIFMSAISISGRDRHNYYDHFPCRYNGKIIHGQKKFDFEINSGSWLYIFTGDTTYILGDTLESHEELFLSSSWTLDDME